MAAAAESYVQINGYSEDSDMAGEATLHGTIVEKDPASPLPAKPHDGLYLLTEDHRLLALVTDFMATQASTEYLHERSRPDAKPANKPARCRP